VVYWMLNPDFLMSMDAQQQVNLALFERFQAAGIEFAHPAPTMIVNTNGEKLLPN